MYSFKKIRSGNMGMIFGVALGTTALVAVVGQFMSQKSKSVQKRSVETRFTISLSSGIETMLMAYRLAEQTYVAKVGVCDTANPFLKALQVGHNCQVSTGSAPSGIDLFKCTGNEPACKNKNLSGAELWTYGSGCTINKDSSNCVVTNAPVMLISMGHGTGTDAQKISADSEKYQFLLTNVDMKKGIAEMIQVAESNDSKQTKHAFAIRSTLPNSAHIEADGRVTQENPDPQNYCPGAPWATYMILTNKKCLPFVELGSGTGLAYYAGRFFGFRPFDGQVIDMLAASSAGGGADSYLVVPSTGKIAATPPVLRTDCVASPNDDCTQIFPKYDKDALINVDDITLISNQLYYVAHSGEAAHIGYLRMTGTTAERIKVCELGKMGWAQAYAGIAALSWSDPLDPPVGAAQATRLARFFLKTDAGDLLTVLIQNTGTDLQNAGATNANLSCFVTKDADLQQVEYKRTYGFDRSANAKPYYIY